jgi:hypothetical protein
MPDKTRWLDETVIRSRTLVRMDESSGYEVTAGTVVQTASGFAASASYQEHGDIVVSHGEFSTMEGAMKFAEERCAK